MSDYVNVTVFVGEWINRLTEKPRGEGEINFDIRLYQAGDEGNIIRLLEEVFNPWPKFDIECSLLDHWTWKFIDNPLNKGVFPHAVADYKGEIIGVSHGMQYHTKVGDGTYLSSKGVDVAVNQNFRGMGIYSKMEKLKHDIYDKLGWQFHYNLTANPFLINKKRDESNFLFPIPIKNLLKIEDVDKFFKHSVKEEDPRRRLYLKTGLIGSKTVNRLTNIQQKAPEPKDVSFREISAFDERINGFYDKVKPSYSFIVEKTMSYMNWRYCDKRGGDYKVWIAEKNDEVIGYLVLRINSLDRDNPIGYIIDVLALDGREDVVDYFVGFAVDYFKERRVNVVRAQLVSGHVYERILSKYGFLDSREKPHLTYTPKKVPTNDIDRFRNATATMLHFPYGELDSI